VTGGWRRLHTEGLYYEYASLNIVRVIESMGMRWSEHVARMGEMEMRTQFLSGSLKGRDHSEDLGIDGKIILECILGEYGGGGGRRGLAAYGSG
jgi:hypothetical protein